MCIWFRRLVAPDSIVCEDTVASAERGVNVRVLAWIDSNIPGATVEAAAVSCDLKMGLLAAVWGTHSCAWIS